MKSIKPEVTIECLVVSDFDQMLSFNDYGKVLANLLGVSEFEFDVNTGEICNIIRVPAGNGKVALLQELEQKLQMSPDRLIYVGDSNSYLCLMYDVNSRAVHTIALSETKSISRICQ